MSVKYITIITKYIFFISLLITISFIAKSDSSVEEIIKGRKAMFSKHYSTAKKVQIFESKGEFEKAKKLMIEMSNNYKDLLEYFPNNTKEGFETKAASTIWENKDEFNNLMTKSADDIINLLTIIETSDDVKITLNKLMWGNCKACHSKFKGAH